MHHNIDRQFEMGRLVIQKIASIASIFICADKTGRNCKPMMFNAQSVNLQSQTFKSVTQKRKEIAFTQNGSNGLAKELERNRKSKRKKDWEEAGDRNGNLRQSLLVWLNKRQ